MASQMTVKPLIVQDYISLMGICFGRDLLLGHSEKRPLASTVFETNPLYYALCMLSASRFILFLIWYYLTKIKYILCGL